MNPSGVFSFTYSLYIYGYVFRCRSELGSRSCEKTLTPINENQSQNRKLNRPVNPLTSRNYSSILSNGRRFHLSDRRETFMLLKASVALLHGWMPATAFTTKMNPRFTAKLLKNGRTSARKRLFSTHLTTQRRKCSIQPSFI